LFGLKLHVLLGEVDFGSHGSLLVDAFGVSARYVARERPDVNAATERL
jgi:hypothetical protein